MQNFANTYEPFIRFGVFAGIFLTMTAWEIFRPRRMHTQSRTIRWPGNIGVLLIDVAVLRILFPTTAVGLAFVAQNNGWGLLNIVQLPEWFSIIVAITALDLAIYLQHVAFHAVPVLWRLHRMHHADLDFDVTTGVRFHPVEILLSMAIKFFIIVALGAPPLSVLVFEILLNATSMFNHGNVGLSRSADRVLRWFVVTPDMHRVHHSIRKYETNSNYGFNVPWWDRLFGTYRDQPEAGHEGMTIGIEQFRDTRDLRLDRMLVQPFRGDQGGGPPAA